jgi:tripartite-type tricarboxylate transporter receptor subunit TctC
VRLSLSRRAFLAGTACAAVVPASRAQTSGWPERTIQITHGFGVGGNADVISRIVAVGSTELLGKHIHFLYETPTLLLELIRSGSLRAIAVTGSQRFFALPDVPTIGETVRGYETTSWLGLAGPPNLPEPIVARLNKEVHGFLADPAIVERLRTLGNVPTPTSPAAFKERVAADVAKWTRVGADVGLARTKLAQ